MAEIIIGVISIIVDIIALVVSAMALNSVNTDKSDVSNELKKVKIKGDYVGRDKNK